MKLTRLVPPALLLLAALIPSPAFAQAAGQGGLTLDLTGGGQMTERDRKSVV